MTSSNDSDLFETLSLTETDASSDFELVDVESDGQPFDPSSTGSDTASTTSEVTESMPSSPVLDASSFHFPDPVSVFHDDACNLESSSLESSSLCTLMAPSHDANQPSSSHLSPEIPSLERMDLTPIIADLNCDLGDVEKMDPLVPQQKREAPLQPRGRQNTIAPKTAWLVALLAALLIGFKTDSLLGPSQQHVALHIMKAGSTQWGVKFASPASTSATALFEAEAQRPSPGIATVPSLASSSSSSKRAVFEASEAHRQNNKPPQQRAETQAEDTRSAPPRPASLALQKTTDTSQGLTLVSSHSTDSGAVKDPTRPSDTPVRRAKSTTYMSFAGQVPFQIHPDLPVLPPTSASSYLDNATTTTWAFWLKELNVYNQLVLRPAIRAAKEQAFEAARLARRVHQEQVLPAFACLCEHAVYTAHRTAQLTAELTAQCNEDQVRPAFAFVREHATQTAQRTADYHEHVVAPALAKFRQQAVEAAKLTSEGLNKAAKRFSSEATETVEQVKQATYLNLEALGVDEYIGFMMTTVKTMKQHLRASERSV